MFVTNYKCFVLIVFIYFLKAVLKTNGINIENG